eukprot:g12148.t1
MPGSIRWTTTRGPEEHLTQRLGATARSFGIQFGAGEPLNVGDVIGIACNQATFPVSVTAWHNGAPVPAPMPRGLKGELWPSLFLSDCAGHTQKVFEQGDREVSGGVWMSLDRKLECCRRSF